MEACSFPMLSPREIASGLSELGIVDNLTSEDILNPTTDVVYGLYGGLLACIDPLGDYSGQASFRSLEHLENPENHTDSIRVIHMYCKVKDIASASGAPDFSLKDICKPSSDRTIRFVSAIHNLLLYRQEKLNLIRDYAGETVAARHEELEERKIQLDKQLLQQEVINQQEQPFLTKLEAEVKDLEQNITNLNKTQAKLRSHYATLKKTEDGIQKEITSIEFMLSECERERTSLQASIVQSPDKLQKALEEKKFALNELKDSEHSFIQRFQALSARNELYKKALGKLSKYLSEMQDMQGKINNCKSIEKDVKSVKSDLNNLEMMAMSLEADHIELQRKVDCTERAIKTLEHEKALKYEEATAKLNAVKTEVDSELHKLAVRSTKIEEATAEVHKIKSNIHVIREEGEALMFNLGRKCEEVVNEFKSYSAPIREFLSKQEEESAHVK